MGRMLETLKHGARAPKDAGTRVPEESVVDWSLRAGGQIPFVEIGAGKKIEGSPDVMATNLNKGQKSAVQPPHLPLQALAAEARAVELTKTKPMSAALAPWPAAVPSQNVAPEIIAFHQPQHPISKQYAELFAQMLECQTQKSPPVLALVGAKPHVGATTVLVNLAVVSTQANKRTLLVDARLAQPMLAQRLGLCAPSGLQEVLAGTAALELAIQKTPVPALDLLSARADSERATGQWTPQGLSWVVVWVKARYDVILVDGPSLEETAHLALLGPVCDGVYLVLPRGAQLHSPQAMAQLIAGQGARLRGLIHTHFEM
ncbi:MAG: CpsD/CapB family tyrosine-protein kinase [Gemmataceae bacterium]|nr:CpsD/CapB family tyrosine-protein kinase [Gemmataceae bacterium]